jgi:hypothetical protein
MTGCKPQGIEVLRGILPKPSVLIAEAIACGHRMFG